MKFYLLILVVAVGVVIASEEEMEEQKQLEKREAEFKDLQRRELEDFEAGMEKQKREFTERELSKRAHKPLYGFMCNFPRGALGNWTQTDNPTITLRINKKHIHMMNKKFRCIDKHRGMVLVKEEMRGAGLTCVMLDTPSDTATLTLSLKKHYPEKKEVRIDWRDTCNDVPAADVKSLTFARV